MKITLNNLHKKFAGQTIIANLSCTITSQHITTLLGPSGCGKTTLLRMIAGLEMPDAGEIWFDERCVFSAEKSINIAPEKRQLGFVFQDFALWPHMTVFENVAFGLRAQKNTQQLSQKVQSALEQVKLAAYSHHYPSQLSGGQQQRVAFARAIITRPHCILFDEPLSALDALLRESMRSELVKMVTSLGISAIFVTHDQLEAMSMSHQVVLLNAGHIEQQGTPEQIYQQPQSPFVGQFIGRSNWLDPLTMFRPETIRFSDRQAVTDKPLLKFEPELIAMHFQGQGYELQLSHNGQKWTAFSPNAIMPQPHLTIYVAQDDLFTFHN